LRFVIDHDVAVTVRGVLIRAGHECWSAAQAHLDDAPDDSLAAYADDRHAALISHDMDFAPEPVKIIEAGWSGFLCVVGGRVR
jgi:predicted nuclease of predicted toxin-antitoxin system